jgi:hypothetical protein
MTQSDHDDLWRDLPKTATEFEKRFAAEEDCRGTGSRRAGAASRRRRAAEARTCGRSPGARRSSAVSATTKRA